MRTDQMKNAQLSDDVASVHRSSSARSCCNRRQTAKPPSATTARMSSFFTVGPLHLDYAVSPEELRNSGCSPGLSAA